MLFYIFTNIFVDNNFVHIGCLFRNLNVVGKKNHRSKDNVDNIILGEILNKYKQGLLQIKLVLLVHIKFQITENICVF